MTVTNIGDTNSKISLTDSTAYKWFMPASALRMKWPMKFVDGTYVASDGGITDGTKAFKLDLVWQFRDVPITSNDDAQNLLKALGYWEANNSHLVLEVKTEVFTTTLCAIGTKAAPTTLVGMEKMTVQNFEITKLTNDVLYVSIEVVYRSQ